MRLHEVSSKRADIRAVAVGHHIEEDGPRRQEGGGVLEVEATSVVGERPQAGGGVRLPQVVLPCVLAFGASRKNRLRAPAESGEIVRPDAPGGDHQVCPGQGAVDPHPGASRGVAQLHHGVRIRAVVHEAGEGGQERGRHEAVRRAWGVGS